MTSLGNERRPLVLRVQTMEKAHEVMAFCEEQGWKAIVGVEPDRPEDLLDLERKLNPPTVVYPFEKMGRNEPCICGSGKKFKKCCLQEAG